MELTFAYFMEVIVTPLTVLIGLLGNGLSILVLNKKEIQLRGSFSRILIALSVFDITFITSSAVLFSLRAISEYYRDYVYPWTVPILLPVAQISLTASVYTTVVTCFDRYVAICRPALLGCCGSEDTTSWGLIIGTVFFSIVYNLSRFFEFRVKWITEELPFSNLTNSFDPGAYNLTENHYLVNKTYNIVEQTDLRSDPRYIQYYILVTNFIFMGIIPSLIMVIFNVLVVRAVNEANKRRARMTRRQQRNITVTSMLVTVVVVFLVCHSVKLFINGYEVYELVKSNVEKANQEPPRLTMNVTNATEAGIMDEESIEQSGWPLWVEYMTIISHWLLILNSSCNFAIYLHKDPKFKAVLKEMFLSKLSPRMRNAIELSIGQDDDNEMKALTPDSRNRNGNMRHNSSRRESMNHTNVLGPMPDNAFTKNGNGGHGGHLLLVPVQAEANSALSAKTDSINVSTRLIPRNNDSCKSLIKSHREPVEV